MARRFSGKYDWVLGDSVGEGGQGFAHWATRLDDRTTNWVLKRLRETVPIERFEREIEALRRLESPRIPPVVDYGLQPGERFYVTPFSGKPLNKWLSESRVAPRRQLDLFSDVVDALVAAHSVHVAHRDIKPNNIVVDESGRASLIDWGLSAIQDEQLVSLVSQDKYGSEAFSAPECLFGSTLECGVEGDIYSLGKVLFWMASGGTYIHRERVRDVLPESINADDYWDRVYISSLIHASVQEGTHARPSAPELRNHLDEVVEAIDHRRARQAEGLVVLWDTLGPRNSHSRSGSRSVTAPPYGNPPAYSELGLRFVVPEGSVLRLVEISLALTVRAGPGEVLVRLHDEHEGQPADVIRSWSIRVTDGVTTIRPPRPPVLQPNQHYWISFLTEVGEVAWWGASSNIVLALPVVFTERYGRAGRWPNLETSMGHAARLVAVRERDGSITSGKRETRPTTRSS